MLLKIHRFWPLQWLWGVGQVLYGFLPSIADSIRIRLQPNQFQSTPKDDILAACLIMEPILKADGFSFSSSKLKFAKIVADVRIEVELQRSKYNRSSRLSSVFPHFKLASQEFGSWRKLKSLNEQSVTVRSHGEVLTIHIGNLAHWQKWIRWDFCAERTRQRRAKYAAKTIRDRSRILSGSINDVGRLFQRVLEYDGVDPAGIIEYIQFRQGDDKAISVARSYINSGILRKRFFDRRNALLNDPQSKVAGKHHLDDIVRWAAKNNFVIR